MSVTHYENFPVASWLCPPRFRPAVVAIYGFARTADDIADEGDAPAAQRHEQLQRFHHALDSAAQGHIDATAWPQVFTPLAQAIRDHALPLPLLHALLDAFEQDVHNPPYPDRSTLRSYCSRSAHPIGRLLLHLADVRDARSAAQSDAICAALQLINFWQDLGRDLAHGRCYIPIDDAQRHGVDLPTWRRNAAHGNPLPPDPAAATKLMRELTQWSVALMHEGAPLALRIPGRFGWELRGVVQGGLRVTDKIRRAGFATWSLRPKLQPLDVPLLAWRAWRMRAPSPRAGEGVGEDSGLGDDA
jgi:hydroxysqualene synthase